MIIFCLLSSAVGSQDLDEILRLDAAPGFRGLEAFPLGFALGGWVTWPRGTDLEDEVHWKWTETETAAIRPQKRFFVFPSHL